MSHVVRRKRTYQRPRRMKIGCILEYKVSSYQYAALSKVEADSTCGVYPSASSARRRTRTKPRVLHNEYTRYVIHKKHTVSIHRQALVPYGTPEAISSESRLSLYLSVPQSTPSAARRVLISSGCRRLSLYRTVEQGRKRQLIIMWSRRKRMARGWPHSFLIVTSSVVD
jgi:hypothetical protein